MGLLEDLAGGGGTSMPNLNQLVRPPDPLGAALAEMSQRFAQAGQASRLPTSTLGALGSALGGAGAAADAANKTYLDQAIKLQTLQRALKQAGYDDTVAKFIAQRMLSGGGAQAAPAAPPVVPTVTPTPGAPPAVAPGAPPAVAPAAGPRAPAAGGGYDPLTGNPLDAPAPLTGGPMQLTGLLNEGGPAAGDTQAAFRPASLVEPARAGNGGTDPLRLAGLLAGDPEANASGAAANPYAGLLATDAPIQPGGPDTLVGNGVPRTDVQLTSAAPVGAGNWEVRNNNFAGMRKPGVIAGPNAGGFQAFSSPEEGIGAISNQLDRYATGKTTGKPLTTLREMVSTWAPPNENPTAQLIDRASKVTGFDPDQPLNVGDPATKAKLVDAFIRNEQGGRNPVPMDVIGKVVGAGGDGSSSPIIKAQYTPGAGGAPAGVPDAAAVINGLMQQRATSGGGGMIPGLNMTPQEVAALNALSTLAGHPNPPFKEFLDLYYKDPQYLQDAARAGQLGKAQVDLQYAPLTAGLTTMAQTPGLKQQAQDKAEIDRVTDELKQRTAAGYKTDETLTVQTANGPVQMPVTAAQKADILSGRIKAEDLAKSLYGNASMAPKPNVAASGAPAAGAPAPDASPGQPAVGSVVGMPYFTPAQTKRNEAAQTDFDENVAKPFQAGQKALLPLTQIENAMGNFKTGPGAETGLELQKAWQSLSNTLGLTPNSDLAKSIASGEIIRKSGNALGFELARSLGAHEAENVVNQAIQSNPGLSVSPTGNTQLIGLIKQGIQRDFDKHQFYNQWFDGRIPGSRGGSYVGADDAFNQSHPVEAYVSQILPYKVQTPADAAKLKPGTRFVTPDGDVRIVPRGQ